MKKFTIASCIATLITAGSASAVQGPVCEGVPRLDHVFVIMMENHAYGQIANNPQAPFINSLMAKANLATNYFAIAHPSNTNYLEVVGGSNFNKLSDQYPDWHNANCVPNIVPGQTTNTDSPNSGVFCPISGKDGTDAAIPVLDNTTNETSAPPLTNINGKLSIPAGTKIDGISIADQLVWAGKSWKSYQEGLPIIGADGVNVSDGYYTIGGNNAEGVNVTSDFAALSTSGNPVSASDVVYLYAVKHNPFVYFASVQEGRDPGLSLNRTVAFEGQKGLYADLKNGSVPDLAFIAPNQCNDQHGRGNGTAFCNYDADDNGTQTGPQPLLDHARRPCGSAHRDSDQGIARLAQQPQCHRYPVGRERLQHAHHESGCVHRRDQLWLRPAGPKFEVLQPLLPDQDTRRGLRAPLPESCLRCQCRGDVGFVLGIRGTLSYRSAWREGILPPMRSFFLSGSAGMCGAFLLCSLALADVVAGADASVFDARSTGAAPCGTGTPPPGHTLPEVRPQSAGITLTVRQDGNRLCYVANGNADAPVIRARLGSELTVTLANEITDPAAIDGVSGPGKLTSPNEPVPNSAGFYPVLPGMRHPATGATNLHVHGFAVPPVKPQDDVLTVCTDPASGPVGCGQRSFTYHYQVPADMPEGLYWYHPHVHGEVQAQMLMGLTGAIVIEGPRDDARRALGIEERVLIVRQTQDLDAGKTQAAAMTAAPSTTPDARRPEPRAGRDDGRYRARAALQSQFGDRRNQSERHAGAAG